MTPNEYQQKANRTLLDKPIFELTDEQTMILWNALGLAGEAGEVAEIIKKKVFHLHSSPDLLEKVKKELGDVLWYVAALCTELNFTMEEIMEGNIEKLMERYPDGFKVNDSINRKENKGYGFDTTGIKDKL